MIIHEVGLRDGLQMESAIVHTDKKFEWIRKIIYSGIKHIQVGSFVNPSKVPQMADTGQIFDLIHATRKTDLKFQDVIFSCLILNERGFDSAIEHNADMICTGVSASETHCLKNSGKSIKDALEAVLDIIEMSKFQETIIQVSVQSVFGCGFEGSIDEKIIFKIVDSYLNAGVRKISLADTAGHASPTKVNQLYSKLNRMAPDIELACHFHNTYGLGIANCIAAMDAGVSSYETSFGGLGGCPFTKLSAGNVCTEDFIHFLFLNGMPVNYDLKLLCELSSEVSSYFNRELPGYVYKTGGII
ncbi:MAG: hydroxymethylglutaryl-CoA lyase [Candidatus Kapabacteria bacterium]|nr:hydroxymethylglutaryl-CoA lyase [Candidatus Kapabacteria bacterium]